MREARRFLQTIEEDLTSKRKRLRRSIGISNFPTFSTVRMALRFHVGGFDAVLGNPPYISTHTSSEENWRDILGLRAGFLEDLYVHFTDLGFRILKPGGGFGFIVSDTFFTLASKLKMRELLQSRALDWLGQCDPFDATVDAAIFVARNDGLQQRTTDSLSSKRAH